MEESSPSENKKRRRKIMKNLKRGNLLEKRKLLKNQFLLTILALLTFIFLSGTNLNGLAQEKELQINKQEKEQVIHRIGEILNNLYVYPEKAEKMSSHITEKLKGGDYDSITSHQEFGSRVTNDLREISKDLHIRVVFGPEFVERLRREKENQNDPELIKLRLKELRKTNFGFKEVKILPCNIGYLDLRQFAGTQYAGETAVAAMNFLANCDALIIDIRNNGGGSPEMIQLLTSYFYEGEPIHLNSFYWRPGDTTTQTWTLPHVPGKRIPDIDIYVLTSNRTFSAAEEFSYNLKNLKRATLIGETTGGGAHPGGPEIVNDNFTINVPKGRAINPITNTNWEGVGVEPDIKVPQNKALATAHVKAIEKLIKSTKDENDKFGYEWHLESLKAELSPADVSSEILRSYAGKYGPRTIIFENGELFYQRESRPKYKMIPMSDELFMFKELDYFRIKIIRENGVAKAVMGIYDTGRTDKNIKNQ
jgi:hypothetical protein